MLIQHHISHFTMAPMLIQPMPGGCVNAHIGQHVISIISESDVIAKSYIVLIQGVPERCPVYKTMGSFCKEYNFT